MLAHTPTTILSTCCDASKDDSWGSSHLSAPGTPDRVTHPLQGSGLAAGTLCDLGGSLASQSPTFHPPVPVSPPAGLRPQGSPVTLEGGLEGWTRPGLLKGSLSWAPYSQPRLARPTIPSGPWGATG